MGLFTILQCKKFLEIEGEELLYYKIFSPTVPTPALLWDKMYPISFSIPEKTYASVVMLGFIFMMIG